MQFKGPNGEVVTSNGSQAANDFVVLYAQLSQEAQQNESEWVAMLRSEGVKAAHPDDGWVDRKNNMVNLAYPQFNDGLEIGDQIALGLPDKWRIVEVVATVQGILSTYYEFTAC